MTTLFEKFQSFIETGRKRTHTLKFGHSERGTKFEKIFHLKFDATE